MEICVAEPRDTPRVMSCYNQQISVSRLPPQHLTKYGATLQGSYQLVLKGKYDCPSMLCCITNYWNQDYTNKAHR
jgi:hypothetical protein